MVVAIIRNSLEELIEKMISASIKIYSLLKIPFSMTMHLTLSTKYREPVVHKPLNPSSYNPKSRDKQFKES